MSYAPESGAAYASLPRISPKQSIFYTFLKSAGRGSAGYSNRQMSRILDVPINVVTPRILELRELGLVELAGKRRDVYSQIVVSHWRIAE